MHKDSSISEVKFQVDEMRSGCRLDILLFDMFPMNNRQTWKQKINEGRVYLNDNTCKSSKKVNSGDIIWFEFIKKPEPSVNEKYSFLYGINPYNDIIAVNKPPNLPVHPAGIYFNNTLTGLLTKDWGEHHNFHLVNRLDRETSGIILLARTPQSCKFVQSQFKEGSVDKEYNVFVEGDFPDCMDATGFIGKSRTSVIKKKMVFSKDQQMSEFLHDWKDCRTEFTCMEKIQIDGDIISHLKVHLHSGRTHQIRATLSSLGFPVVGDRLYGIDESLYIKHINDEETNYDLQRLRITRSALHCSKLIFTEPATNARIELNCELPDDLLTLQLKNTRP